MDVSVTQYIKSVIEIDCSFHWVIATPKKLFKSNLPDISYFKWDKLK